MSLRRTLDKVDTTDPRTASSFPTGAHPDDLSQVLHPHGRADVNPERAAVMPPILADFLPVLAVLMLQLTKLSSLHRAQRPK